MTRRVILLLLAVLIAAGGAVAVWLYVQSVEDQVAEGQEEVQVLVATQTIPFGQTAGQAEEAGALELTTIVAADAVPGALSSIEPIRDLTALTPIFAGEQILEQKFGTPGSTTQLPIPEGQLALSIQLSDPARVAGFVGPGSEVAIFLTAAPPTEGDAPAGVEAELFTTVLIPRIEVIAAGQTTVISRTTTEEGGQQTTEEIPLAILTLAANQQQAQEIIQAQSQGQLYFGLLTDTSETQVGPATTFGDLVTE